MELYDDIKQGEKGAWVSIVTYICLSAFKLIVGYYSNSEALSADGLNNTTDIIASFAVLIGLKISRKPPDKDHPYGHFRAETVAALIASFIMIVVGFDVLRKAILSLFDTDIVSPDIKAAWVALFCSIVMYVIYRYNFNLAKKINNQALMAAAQDNRSDSIVSLGTFVGIIGSQFGLPWLDPLTAVIVGIIICKTAWDIFKEASHTLTDGFDGEDDIEKFKETIKNIPGVILVKDIKGRRHGNSILLDVTIQVRAELNVKESHDITELIEKEMKNKHGIHYVHIHIEPVDVENKTETT
ncbi:MAG: cation diffusion facilitator family transporter [Anoxybacillus sp.]|nr:cation diffusion facilitator family transporter [Anoxybacillus sp.]MCL6585564.1 cation diffusion facilitator family transporter [Anoxybacillus sp.]